MAKCTVKSWTDKLIRFFLDQAPFEVSRHRIVIPHLPQAFHGFMIAQISDLHIDRWNTPVTEAAVNVINSLGADLIVCTGDTIAQGAEFLPEVTYLLKQLQARYGKLACLGNHDYSDGSNGLGVRQALQKAGFDVLVNESTLLSIGRQKIQLAGTDDLILGRQCLHAMSKRLNPEDPVILLSHNPENFPAMAHFKPDLVLSGHTHGGQIYMPACFRRRLMGSPYVAGLYKQQLSQLYVNRGLGAAVLVHHWQDKRISVPTPRWLVPAEISVFELVNPKLAPTDSYRSKVTALPPQGKPETRSA